jgi:hypothetical protein
VFANRAFVLLLLASCGRSAERAPVSRPSASSSPSASSAYLLEPSNDPPRPPSAGDVKPSDVVVTGGFGAEKDRFLRPGDPKPGDTVEAVRFTCETTSCKPLDGVSTSPFSGPFEERLRECFTVKSRPATDKEVAQVTSALSSASGRIDVPAGRIFVIERRRLHREEIMETHECPKDPRQRHPCDPARWATGRFVEKMETDLAVVGPRHSDVSVPFRTWTLSLVELRNLPASIETVDLSTLPVDARAAVVFDRAVEAVRSKDRKRIAAAVKEVDANVTIADGSRIEDQRVPRTLAQTIVNEMPMIRAVAEGRATVGDACKR